MFRLAIALLACSVLVRAQIAAGCTPESMASQKAGSLPTTGVGRWDCYAVNYGPAAVPFSLGIFALDFPSSI